jgi:hypothetical protein
MMFANATKFYRKSGVAEGSAVRPGWLPKASDSHTRPLSPAMALKSVHENCKLQDLWWEPTHSCGGRSASALRETRLPATTRFSAGETACGKPNVLEGDGSWKPPGISIRSSYTAAA